jgi:hypothetical protein
MSNEETIELEHEKARVRVNDGRLSDCECVGGRLATFVFAHGQQQ